jgi:hypothetical protein
MKNKLTKIITVSALFLMLSIQSFSQPNWDAIKANSSFVVYDDSYDEPYLQPLAVMGWEDGVFISRCGLHLFCGYWPVDVFRWLNGIQYDPICFDFTPYFRPPLIGVDTVTNGWGCPNYMHGDIIWATRNSLDEDFIEWQASSLQKPFSIEGAPQGILKDAETWDLFVFTSNQDGFGNENIMFMSNVPLQPDFEDAVPLFATDDIEHNPHIERLNETDLVILFDRGNFIYYSLSYNNGLDWEEPVVITNVINDHAPYDIQPHLWHDGTDWWMYFCADNEHERRSIFKSKQLIENDWNSWGDKEIVISPGDINDGNPGTFILGVGEPTLTQWGDISFVAVYGDFSSTDTTDMFDCDPWILPKKDSPVNRNKLKFDNQNHVKIYPNPAKDGIYINTDAEDYEIQIINLNGQVLYSGKNVGRVDVSGFAKGIYFVRIKTDDKVETKKLIINP